MPATVGRGWDGDRDQTRNDRDGDPGGRRGGPAGQPGDDLGVPWLARSAPGVPGAQLTDDQVKFIGARYNRGPALSDDVLRKSNTKLSYGEALINKRQRVERLLSDQ
jgi:hypothetical protein